MIKRPTITDAFQALADAYIEQAKNSARSLINLEQPKHELSVVDSLEAPPFDDNKEITSTFARDEADLLVVNVQEDPKNYKLNDRMAGKIQSDTLAMAERDYRTQHQVSRIRSYTHAASRRHVHSQATGPVSQGIYGNVRRLAELPAKGVIVQ